LLGLVLSVLEITHRPGKAADHWRLMGWQLAAMCPAALRSSN